MSNPDDISKQEILVHFNQQTQSHIKHIQDQVEELEKLLQSVNEGEPCPNQTTATSKNIPIDPSTASASNSVAVHSHQHQQEFADLHHENLVLNQLVKQYESTLDVIMAKFRLQAQHIQQEKLDFKLKLDLALDEERKTNQVLRSENLAMQSQLDSCMQVMRRAVGASTIENENVLSIVTELARENSNLREMLRIDSSIKEY